MQTYSKPIPGLSAIQSATFIERQNIADTFGWMAEKQTLDPNAPSLRK
jgi:hypothetical protein